MKGYDTYSSGCSPHTFSVADFSMNLNSTTINAYMNQTAHFCSLIGVLMKNQIYIQSTKIVQNYFWGTNTLAFFYTGFYN